MFACSARRKVLVERVSVCVFVCVALSREIVCVFHARFPSVDVTCVFVVVIAVAIAVAGVSSLVRITFTTHASHELNENSNRKSWYKL